MIMKHFTLINSCSVFCIMLPGFFMGIVSTFSLSPFGEIRRESAVGFALEARRRGFGIRSRSFLLDFWLLRTHEFMLVLFVVQTHYFCEQKLFIARRDSNFWPTT